MSTPNGPGTGPGDAQAREAAAREAAARDAAAHDVAARDAAARDQHGSHGTAPGNQTAYAAPAAPRDTVASEEDRYGGIKAGSALLGWFAAVGLGMLLIGLGAAILGLLGLETGFDTAVEVAEENVNTVAIVTAIVLVVVMFIAYYCGGYVAGRMARYDGAKQGLMVFLWGVIVAVIVAVLALIAGDAFNLLANFQALPPIPLDPDELTAGSILTAIVSLLAMAAGAILGGMAGMRYHRRIDHDRMAR